MKTCPYTYVKDMLAQLNPRLWLRHRRLKSIFSTLDEEAMETWRAGHGVFFVLLQGVALELRRFKTAVIVTDLEAARRHIDRAAAILVGSATAMRLAGDVDRVAYANAVIPAMKKAHPKFSGSDSADHDYLVDSFKALGEVINNLPHTLVDSYEKFLISADVAVAAHLEVCGIHRGDDRISTGSGGNSITNAIETLIRLTAQRLRLLLPKSRCPIRGTKRSRTPGTGDNSKNNPGNGNTTDNNINGNNDPKETK